MTSNEQTLKTLNNKFRSLKVDNDFETQVYFSFLYKFLSDNLKSYIEQTTNKQIAEIYDDEEVINRIKNLALNDLGYFISNDDYYLNNLIENHYGGDKLIQLMLVAVESVFEYDDSHYEEYFKEIFNYLISKNKTIYPQVNLIRIKEIIFTIANFNIFESNLTYLKVFDDVVDFFSSYSDNNTDPYIIKLLSNLILSQKGNALKILDPFSQDNSLLFNLAANYDYDELWGYESNKFYIISLIRAIFSNVDLAKLYMSKTDLRDKWDLFSEFFDIISSNLSRFASKKYLIKDVERTSNNKNAKLLKKNLMIKLDVDDNILNNDSEFNDLFNDLISKKMEMEVAKSIDFPQNYESLIDDEYLILNNLLNALNNDGIMAIVVPQSFLFKNKEQLMRQFLVLENNYIDAVINLPDDMYYRSRLSQAIVIFKKNKVSDDVLFIDTSTLSSVSVNSDNFLSARRRRRYLTDDKIDKIVEIYSQRKECLKLSSLASVDEIKENDCNLSVSRYVDTYEGEFIRLDDLASQNTKLESQSGQLKEKINKLMEELDIKF